MARLKVDLGGYGNLTYQLVTNVFPFQEAARVKYAMAYASMKLYTNHGSTLYLKTSTDEEFYYKWTALMVFGDKSTVKFGQNKIKHDDKYIPWVQLQVGFIARYSLASFYEKVFKHHLHIPSLQCPIQEFVPLMDGLPPVSLKEQHKLLLGLLAEPYFYHLKVIIKFKKQELLKALKRIEDKKHSNQSESQNYDIKVQQYNKLLKEKNAQSCEMSSAIFKDRKELSCSQYLMNKLQQVELFKMQQIIQAKKVEQGILKLFEVTKQVEDLKQRKQHATQVYDLRVKLYNCSFEKNNNLEREIAKDRGELSYFQEQAKKLKEEEPFGIQKLSQAKNVEQRMLIVEKERINYYSKLFHEKFNEFGIKIRDIKTLLSNGADINYQSVNGSFTALMLAVDANDERIVEYLLVQGADPTIRNYHNEKASDLACSSSSIYTMLKNYELLFAVSSNNLEAIPVLLREGAELNFQDRKGYSALLLAVEFGYIPIINFLLQQEADVSLTLVSGKDIFDLATNENVIDLLTTAFANSDESSLEIQPERKNFANFFKEAGDELYHGFS